MTPATTHRRLFTRFLLERILSVLLIFGCVKAAGQTYTVQVGAGTATNGNVPVNTNYGYNYTQQIYTAADITSAGGNPGAIRKIRFYLAANVKVTNSSDIRVLMGNTTKGNFTGNTDWIPVANLQEVFNSAVQFPESGPAWVEISLQSDFLWDGTSNIVVAIDENTPNFGTQASWGSTAAADNKSIYYRNDSNNPNPASLPTATGRAALVPNIQFEFAQTPCSGTPVAGSTVASLSRLCGSGTVVLTPENKFRMYSGLGYQWESSPDGVTDWQPVSEANNASYTATVSTTTWFRVVLSCGSSATNTAPVQILVNAHPDITTNFSNIATCGSGVTLTATGATTFEWAPAQGLDLTTGPSVTASPVYPTVYTVTGTDDNNCRNTAKVTVSPFASYRPRITGVPESSCASGTPVTITVSNPLENPDVEYELRDAENNVLIPWQSETSFAFTPSGEGVFAYQVIARIPGCGDPSQPGRVRVYRSFAADISTINDCAANSGTILIGNARGAALKEETWANTFSAPQLPPAVTLFGAASISEGRAVITPSAQSQKGGIQLSGITTINPGAIRLAFKLTADQPLDVFGTGGADGLSWSFGDDADYSSAITNGAGSKLRLVFDAANNGSSNGNTLGIYLTYGYTGNNPMGPASTGTIAYSADFQSWKKRTDTPVLVVIDEDSRLTLTVNEQVIFDHVQLPAEYAAADKSQWKHLFSALTGGDALRQAISELTITASRPDFVYGISAGGSGTLPTSWQAAGTFTDLPSPAAYDVWIAAAGHTADCHKLLGTTRLLYPLEIGSVSKTELTGCGSDDGAITLGGLVAHATYQVNYVSSVSGNLSADLAADGTGNIVLTGLSPATYSDISISDGSCTSTTAGPVIIARPATPVLLALSSGSNTDCAAPNGAISLFSADFVPGSEYEVWYNGASRGKLAADADKLITVSGLATGDYSNIYVVTAQQCTSNTIALKTVTGVAPAPVITAASVSAQSNCNGATGVIQLTGTFNAGSVSVSYRKNGVPLQATMTATEETLNLTGLTTGVYDSFSVTSGCASNTWTDAVVVSPTGTAAPASGNAFKTDIQGADVTVDYYDNNCGLIASLNSSVGNMGNVSVIVTVTGNTALFGDQPYIGRYYDIQTANPVGGTVTLYFTDTEINQYNARIATLGDPRFPTIGTNGENLRITVYHSSAPGSGPEGYDRTLTELIRPAEVIRHPSGFWTVTFVTGGFSGFFAHTNQNESPLPVALKSFAASNEGSVNKIQWSTTEEVSADRFVVERSADGRKFTNFRVVQATGTPGHNYLVTDELPVRGINYYRLKVENSDGTGFYSKIVTAKYESKIMEIAIGPNPVSDLITVRLNEKVTGIATLRLIDLTGRVIAEKTVGDENLVQFSMQHLDQGIYIIQFQNDHFVRNVKVVKE